MAAEDVLREMIRSNIETVRDGVSQAQAELLKFNSASLDDFDDHDMLASLAQGTSALAKSSWPSSVALLLMVLEGVVKGRSAES